jgi:hypothetical protein
MRLFVRQIKVDTIFTSYRIQSNASNAITLSLHSEALLAALKPASVSASDTEDVVVKLAKKNDQAVLSFEITGLTRVGRKLHVAHDVKIEVMKPCDVEKLSEPMCPEPDVSTPDNTPPLFTVVAPPVRSTSCSLLCRNSERSLTAFVPYRMFLQSKPTITAACRSLSTPIQ